MTASVNTTCDTLTVTNSTGLTTWMDNSGYTLTLKYRNNCASTYTEYTVKTTDVSGTSPNYTFSITAANLISSTTSTLDDGVYTIKFVLTEDSTGNTTEEVDCMLTNCNLECDVVEYQVNNPTSLIRMWYDSLITAIDCDNCDCSIPCAIWEKIQNMLGETTTDDCQCG